MINGSAPSGAFSRAAMAASLAVSNPPHPLRNRTHAPRCGERMPSCPIVVAMARKMKKTPTRAVRLNVMGKFDIDPFTPRRLI
jgi:hypothetical protein